MKKLTLTAVLLGLCFFAGCGAADNTYTRSFFAMDTSGYITIDSKYREICDKAVSEIYRLEELLSVSREESDVYRLNHADGRTVEVDSITAELIGLCIEYNKIFEGFDITLKNVSDLWNFNSSPVIPDRDALEKALKSSGMDKLFLEGTAVRLDSRAKLDLGGAAKGYAVSLCADILHQGGAADFVINVGGNIYVSGNNSDGQVWKIGIKEPFADGSSTVGYIEKTDVYCVTSGVYERFFESGGEIYHHLIDPSTGRPFDNGLWSAVVVTSDGKASDILSTALFSAGLEEGLAYANRTEGLEAIFITDSREVYITDGLKDSFTFTGGKDGYVFKN